MFVKLLSRSDLVLSPNTQQPFPLDPNKRKDDVDVALIKETQYALRTMREYTENHDSDNVFTRLIIEEPEEFRGKFI